MKRPFAVGVLVTLSLWAPSGSVEPRRVHDQMVVVGDLVVRVLRHLAQDVPELERPVRSRLRRSLERVTDLVYEA